MEHKELYRYNIYKFLRKAHWELSFLRGTLSGYQFNSISAVLRWALRVRMDAYSGLGKHWRSGALPVFSLLETH